MSAPFRLVNGGRGPRQQSPTTCGAACATVARMLVDAPFARWIVAGEGHLVPGAEGGTQAERFAAWERTVHARTNGGRTPGGALLMPWPRALGTPPWGLKHELENGASRVGTRYRILSVRGHSQETLRARYRRLLDLVEEGQPAALYVGNALLPRHVTLILPGERGRLGVYEPHAGLVRDLDEDDFAGRRLGLGGWDVPWILVQPTGHRRVAREVPSALTWRVPSLAPGPTPEVLQRGPGEGVSSSEA